MIQRGQWVDVQVLRGAHDFFGSGAVVRADAREVQQVEVKVLH